MPDLCRKILHRFAWMTPSIPDFDQCYRAICERDARYDGIFYTCVKTTGIFCRPICPARVPKSQNCIFCADAESAIAAGFRACLRCRPESTPGSPAWRGTQATTDRGRKLVARLADEPATTEALAASLGLSSRHVRRLFQRHLQASPKQIMTRTRLETAAQRLAHTDLSITAIALDCGFSSLRRFQEAVRQHYGLSPSQWRMQLLQNDKPI